MKDIQIVRNQVINEFLIFQFDLISSLMLRQFTDSLHLMRVEAKK